MEMPELSNPLPDHIDFSENKNKYFSRKNIITFLVIGIGLLVIPFSVRLVEQTNVFKIKATGNEISFVPGDNMSCDSSGNCKALATNFQVLLKSPLGPPGTPVPTPTSTPTPEPTAGPTPTAVPGPTDIPGSTTPTPITTPTSTPYPTPVTPSGGWPCQAAYTLTPASPGSGNDFSVTVSAATPNIECVVLYQDGQAVNCSANVSVGTYNCTANGGSVGQHVLQLKFGQSTAYPGVSCNQAVDCSFQTYQTQ